METMVVEGQKKPKRPELQELVDRISALPDCLLLEILSRLGSTKRTIRTGLLSKRWKHLWTWVPCLYFYNYIRPRSKFFSYVDKTLAQCGKLKLKKFIVYTCYDIRFQLQVNGWIHYAISCNVEEIDLKLWNNAKFKGKLVLNQIFFISSCFTDLTLEGCMFTGIRAVSWKNLRSLCISDGNLDEDLIEKILSGGPVLETLVLNDCYGYRRLDITSKSVKNLVFSGYSASSTRIIEINAPNILSLTIQDELVLRKLLLVNVSSLVKANLDYKNSITTPKKVKEEMLKELILNLHHVEELKIGDRCSSKVLSRLEAKGFAFPSNMKLPVTTYRWSDSDSSDSDTSDSDSSDRDSVSDTSDSDSSDSDSVSDTSDGDSSLSDTSDSDSVSDTSDSDSSHSDSSDSDTSISDSISDTSDSDG